MIDRNPDIRIDLEDAPPGCYIHPGNYLMRYARLGKIPYGVAREAKKTVSSTGKIRRPLKTVGLVIREVDRSRFEAEISKYGAA